MLGAFWPAALVFCMTWLLVAVVTRFSSLSALAASILTPSVLTYQGDFAEALLAALMSGLLIWKHRSNISRLMRGEEPKIGDTKIADSKARDNA